ncbi:GntR family transcriptional regulator [Hoeflea poritis]|uniref:GntR family transcriptional regulator n=1 Tax=Hoeflea poritis TaxID=2993659 RepID=A0ABT4VN73_9HYPH|nr:GntR family transcriptional regulator [Hoeflea poritis]MDA4846168.1 GntR family transcriptional regulator [Hoeflea poritis]
MSQESAAEFPETSFEKAEIGSARPDMEPASGMPGLGPARQVNLRELVYDQLKDAFMVGYFAPGDYLNLRELADRFETSITPVREAVRRLVAEGALIDAPGRALRVPPLRRAHLIDLRQARIGIESMITEMAVARATPHDLDALGSILDGAVSKNPKTPIDELTSNRKFHFSLYGIGGSPTLFRFVESLWLQYGPFLNLIHYTIDPDIRGSHKDHRRIIAAARDGDALAAKQALVADISRSFDILDAYTQDSAD